MLLCKVEDPNLTNGSSSSAFEKRVSTSAAAPAQHGRDEVDVSMGIDPEVVGAHDNDRCRPKVERSRELALRQQRDKAATRHSYQADVVRGDDLPVADGELPNPKGGIGDG